MELAQTLVLTGQEMHAFVEALSASFSVPRLKQMLRFRLEKDLDEISLAGDKITMIFDVVDAAQKEGWIAQLFAASRASQPGNPKLLAFATVLGLDPVSSVDRSRLEKIVRERSQFVDFAGFRARSALLEACVCSVESPSGAGTGFLVGPNLVLTNYHVVEQAIRGAISPKDIRCRFDFLALADGRTVETGRTVSLASEWRLADRPYSRADLVTTGGSWGSSELDYALLQLLEAVGQQPLGGRRAEPGASQRGWLTLPVSPVSVEAGDVLIIVQHPQDLEARPAVRQLPMQLAIGEVIGFSGNGIRLRHATTTLPGSSGSPCCTANLDLVALHHAGDPRDWPDFKGTYNQAIPIGLIANDLRSQGIKATWDSNATVHGNLHSPQEANAAVEAEDEGRPAEPADTVETLRETLHDANHRQTSPEGLRTMSGSGSVSIGGNVIGGVIVTGHQNEVKAAITACQRPPSQPIGHSIMIASELASIRAIIEYLSPEQTGKIARALDDATEESAREHPDKNEVGEALRRALRAAQKADGFAAEVDELVPHVKNAVLWLGDSWTRLLRYVT